MLDAHNTSPSIAGTPEGSPLPAPPASGTAPADPAEAAPRRPGPGRPPGSRDKKPRIRNRKKAAAAARTLAAGLAAASPTVQAEAATPAPDAPGVFVGGVAGEAEAGTPEVGALDLNAIAALPPEALAAVLLQVGEGVLVNVAGLRYGPELAAEHLALKKEERATLEPLTAEWLKTTKVQLSPGQALVGALVLVLGNKAMALEVAHRARRAPGVAP